MIRPGGVLICRGNKSSGSLGEALPGASFAPPLVITLSLPGLKSVSLDIASAHMATLKAFFNFFLLFFSLHSSKGRCGWKCLLKDQLKQFWFTQADNVVRGSMFANLRGILNPQEVFWCAGAGGILQSKPLGAEGKIRRDQWVEAVWFCFLAGRIPEGILFPSLPPPFFPPLFAHQGLNFWVSNIPMVQSGRPGADVLKILIFKVASLCRSSSFTC